MAVETEVGPIASKTHMERILSFVDHADQDGDELLGGGHKSKSLVKAISKTDSCDGEIECKHRVPG